MPPIEDLAEKDTGFDEAFASFTSAGTPPAEESADEDTDKEKDDGTPEEEAGDEGAGGADDGDSGGDDAEDGAGGEVDGAEDGEADEDDAGGVGDDTAPEGTDTAAAAGTGEDILNRLAGLLKDQPAKEAPAQEEGTPDAPAAEDDIYTPEELEVLKEYDKEWPEVSTAERLRRRAEYRDIMKYMFEQVAAAIAPIHDTVEQLAVRTQLEELTTANPDYEEIRDQVVEWVGTQPQYLQAAYKQVMKSGTVEEVTDLFNRYRDSTGAGKPAAPKKPGTPKAEPSETAKKAAKSLAPVSTKRSTVIVDNDPDDFDAAFKRFTEGNK